MLLEVLVGVLVLFVGLWGGGVAERARRAREMRRGVDLVRSMRDDTRNEDDPFDGEGHWAVVELYGHVKFGAHVVTDRLAGVSVLRVRIPGLTEDEGGTQYLRGGSIYRLTPCSQRHAEDEAVSAVTLWRRHATNTVPFSPTDEEAAAGAEPKPKRCAECGTEWPVGTDVCSRCGSDDGVEYDPDDIPF